MTQRTRGGLLLIAGIACVINVFAWRAVLSPVQLSVVVLPTENGTSVLLRTPEGYTALINTGADASILRALGETLPEWKRNIDILFLTDLAPISAGGISALLQRYEVRMLARPEARGTKAQESSFADAISGGSPVVRYARRGDRFALGNTFVEVLWPPDTPSIPEQKDGSLVLRVTHRKTSFLVRGALSVRTLSWETSLDGRGTIFVISSSTPAGTYSPGDLPI